MALPEENLDNKNFRELVNEAISRIPVYAPEWTDHNVHDPGITFIELFAWLTEIQIFRLNKITDRSKRKFLKLVGISRLNPAKAAWADVTFTLGNDAAIDIPAGTLIAAPDPVSEKDIIFETGTALRAVDSRLMKIYSHPFNGMYIDNTDANWNENVHYYAFSDLMDPLMGECGPKKGDELYLGFDQTLTCNVSSEMIPLTFYLFEEDLSKTGRYCGGEPDLSTSVRLNWKYYIGGDWNTPKNWKDVETIRDETNNLTVSGKVWIKITGTMVKTNKIPDDDDRHEELFWLRCKVEEAGYESPPKIDCILMNTVSASQRTDLKETRFSAKGLPDHQIDLKDVHVLDGTLEVHINRLWKKVEDFDASKPGDEDYTVEYIAEQATTRLTFGDGINGKIPPEGDNNIIVRYRQGGGVRGNVKPGTITRVLDEQLAEKVNICNIKAASGGEEAETLDEGIQRARRELKEITRAVTPRDYEELAKNTPGLRVARAKAIPGYHPIHHDKQVPGVVTVIVVPMSPYDKPKPSEDFLKTVYAHLDKSRMLTTELFVIRPEYIKISVTANVKIKPQYAGGNTMDKVSAKLRSFLDPINGGVDGRGWPFGRSVYASEIYEIIDRVDGIDFVETVSLKGNREGPDILPDRNGDIDIREHELACSGKHTIMPIE